MDKIKFGDYVIPDGSIAPRSRPLPEPTARWLGVWEWPAMALGFLVPLLLVRHALRQHRHGPP